MSSYSSFLILILSVFIIFCGCDARKQPFSETDKRPHILVFVAMAVADPVAELVTDFNKSSECKVYSVYGGSTHLKRTIEISRKGDIFFPGIGTYIDDMDNNGLITSKYNIGFYSVSVYVRKGNPLNIGNDLSILVNPLYRVGIGDYASSGIGRSTKLMLSEAGIYEAVQKNAVVMSSDSKELLQTLVDGKTDIVLDWANLIHADKYSQSVEKIDIKSPYFTQVPLTIGILKYSKERNCAEEFIKLIASDKGRAVFRKYDMAVK